MASDGANLFSFSHENCEKLKRFAPSKTDSETCFDSHAYVGISTIIHLQLFYISRNPYKYKTNVYTAGVNRLLNTVC